MDMKSKLIYEGWVTDEKLPNGWLIKQKTNKSNMFLAQGGECFSTLDEAKIFVAKYSEYFSTDDIEKMKKYENKDMRNYEVKNKRNNENRNKNEYVCFADPVHKDTDEDWVKDSQTVPEGWAVKDSTFGDQIIRKIKAPNGKVFQSSRSALKYLIEGNYPQSLIESMRNCLEHDGWLKDKNLPENWFYKLRNINQSIRCFLSSCGNIFQTKEAAILHLDKENRTEEMEKLNAFVNPYRKERFNANPTPRTKTIKKEVVEESYIINHPTVPAGWSAKEKYIGSVKVWKIVSPEGKVFEGKRVAIAFMVQEDYPEEQIDEMRKCLELDGWMPDERLPPKWLAKRIKSKQQMFISDDGLIFYTKQEALSHLEKTNQHEAFTILKKFGKETKDCSSLKENYISHPSVPIGWQVRDMSLDSSLTWSVLAPNGRVFPGKRQALAHMIKQGFPEEDITVMRNGLAYDGWLTHDHLPKNWFYKKLENKETKIKTIKFISSEGNLFKSRELAIKHLRNFARVDEEKLLRGFDETETEITERMNLPIVSMEHGNIPGPSMESFVKEEVGNTVIEDLATNHNVVTIEENDFNLEIETSAGDDIEGSVNTTDDFNEDWAASDEELTDMEIGNSEENDNTNEDLNENGASSDFDATMDDSIFEDNLSSFEAPTIENNQGTLNSDLDDAKTDDDDKGDIFENIFNHKEEVKESSLEQTKLPDAGYLKCEEPFLKGWTYKSVVTGVKKQWKCFKSPTGIRLKGRRLVLKYMIEKNFPEEQIFLLRKSFEEEGWKSDDKLPNNWFYRNDKRLQFLSSSGNFYNSKEQALKFLNLFSMTKNECAMLSNFLEQYKQL